MQFQPIINNIIIMSNNHACVSTKNYKQHYKHYCAKITLIRDTPHATVDYIILLKQPDLCFRAAEMYNKVMFFLLFCSHFIDT